MDIQLKRGLLEVCVLAAIKNEDSYGYIFSFSYLCIPVYVVRLYKYRYTTFGIFYHLPHAVSFSTRNHTT